MPFPRGTANIFEEYSFKQICSGPVVCDARANSSLVCITGAVPLAEGSFLGCGGYISIVVNTSSAAVTKFGLNYGDKIQILSGEWRGRHAIVVGVRHGALWMQGENEPAALCFPWSLYAVSFRLLASGASGSVRVPEFVKLPDTLDLPIPRNVDGEEVPYFRFPTQRGGLGLFHGSAVTQKMFGLLVGQVFMYKARSKKGLSRKATVIGVREGALWRADEFEAEARPFIGIPNRASLNAKYVITLLDVQEIVSVTC
jgi:hypothetical protein